MTRKPKTVIATTLATATAAAIGNVTGRRGINTWYPTLGKPCYVPPNVVFPVVWTALFADIATTSAAAIDQFRTEGQDAQARAYIAALSTNLVLNASWSWLFFDKNKLGASALLAAVLSVSGADLARRAADADPKLGAALAPYPLWCTFATVMTTHIWRLNR